MANFPTSLPSFTVTSGSETLNGAAAGLGLSGLLNSFEGEITAISTKLGTGATTPVANTLLFGTGAGTSAWQTLTSAQLLATISDETGIGALVFGTSPTIATPVLSGSVTGTYTLAGTPTITSPTINQFATGSGLGAAWLAWPTPTWSNLTVGNGSEVSKYIAIGKTIHFNYSLTFGTTTTITGSNPKLTAPVNLSTNYVANSHIESDFVYYDASAGQAYPGIILNSSNTLFPVVNGSAGTFANAAGLGTTTPVAFATSDIISMTGTYEGV